MCNVWIEMGESPSIAYVLSAKLIGKANWLEFSKNQGCEVKNMTHEENWLAFLQICLHQCWILSPHSQAKWTIGIYDLHTSTWGCYWRLVWSLAYATGLGKAMAGTVLLPSVTVLFDFVCFTFGNCCMFEQRYWSFSSKWTLFIHREVIMYLLGCYRGLCITHLYIKISIIALTLLKVIIMGWHGMAHFILPLAWVINQFLSV